MPIEIKSKSEIEKMRATSRLAAEVLDFIAPHVQPGTSTLELDRLCHDYIIERGAYPSPLNYKGFPKSICTSVNEVVCHGIPSESVILKDGDIINIDITTTLDGYFGDTSEMFVVGEASPEAKKLIDVTRQSLWLGIQEVGPNKRSATSERPSTPSPTKSTDMGWSPIFVVTASAVNSTWTLRSRTSASTEKVNACAPA